jgi:hypothetical protein
MHPYEKLPPQSFWAKFVSDRPWRDLQFHDNPKFLLMPETRVATAGSCFAQHISRYMKKVGLDPYVSETAHPLSIEAKGDEVASYGSFSARYGNIYTIRLCLDLLRQAVGSMPVVHDYVEDRNRWFDLLRPRITKEGFASEREAAADRTFHLSRVREMFATVDVFIFTLGLTEHWYNGDSGYIYPACPGTVHGVYDPTRHHFGNFTQRQTVADLHAFITEVKAINPAIKLIFTVSPVPLVATKGGKNVLVASSYSKAVLRSAIGEIESEYPDIDYFPSYEIISNPASFGQYLATDLREVSERGVAHVMGYFLQTYYNIRTDDNNLNAVVFKPERVSKTSVTSLLDLGDDECEELFNDAGFSRRVK